MKIFWTDTALEQLEAIYDFHKYKAGILTSRKLVDDIIEKTLLLEDNPKIGQKEELLINRKFEYRYLVVGNYKIIYWQDNELVKIAGVFDCRRNPIKMVKNL